MRLFLVVLLLLMGGFVYGLRADLNGDCKVDIADLSILMSEWMQIDEECMANNYVTFNGTSGYVTVPHNAALNLGTGADFTIVAMIKPEGLNGMIYEKSDGNIIFQLFLSDGYLSFYYEDVTNVLSYAFQSTTKCALDQWTSIAFVRDATTLGVDYFYYNGIEVENQSMIPFNFDNEANAKLGYAGSTYFDGSMDDFRIYKKALSVSEVQAIYNGGIGTKYTAAVAEGGKAAVAWDMDEGNPATTITATQITDEPELVGTFSETGVSWQFGGTPFDMGGGVSLSMVNYLMDDE